MFHATWTTPRDSFAGTLRFHVDPRRRGLGVYEDVDGVRWDIHGIIGEYVQARKVSEAPSYYGTATTTMSFSSTDGQGGVSTHTWEPYKVEIVNSPV